ncbi:MAG TPA: M50 family metallopeptidase [Streptosporangiaceae bacterium]|nr:M50 family metallopeptidase [Streptosporangiaceae bacterium]
MLATSLESTQQQLAHEFAPLLRPVVLPIVVLVLIVFAVKHIGVIAHEGAHAIAGRSVGRKVRSVKLNSDATGETSTLGPERGLSRVITSFAGYLGPSLFGLGAAGLVALGYTGAVLGLALLFLIILLFRVRNLFGVISVLANGALIVLVMRYGSAKLQDGAAYCLSWLLLLSGVAHVLTHGSNAADAATLRDITHVPRIVWSTLWLVITVAALVAGARMLT